MIEAMKKLGTVICIGAGEDIVKILPICKKMKEAGNRVIGIIGASTKDLIINVSEMSAACDEFFVTTDDGSCGKKGQVTDVLKEILEVVELSTHTIYPDLIYVSAPALMAQAVSDMASKYNIKTVTS